MSAYRLWILFVRIVKRLVPAPLRRLRHAYRERAEFACLPTTALDESPLAPLRDFDAMFDDFTLANEWPAVAHEIANLGITSRAAGVNIGDRRALYYLIRHLRPRTVLEIGTHIGASSVHIAAALRKTHGQDFSLTTVDVIDVNDPKRAFWREMGSTYSPADMMKMLGVGDQVTFHATDSMDFLGRCAQHFDLIFLDGDHAAARVYREVPAALKLLNPGGFILLHDYFPGAMPLWSGGVVVPGPWRAIERFKDEGAAIEVAPLGALPWPTKLGSSITSLAVLGAPSGGDAK
jgi:predicted O-methyltransferase YrrM